MNPSDWPRVRLRYLVRAPIRNGVGESAQADTVEWPRYVRITDIAGPRSLRADTFSSLPPEMAQTALLQDGDLVISAVGATFGKSYLHTTSERPHCYAGYLVKVSPGSKILPSFLSYWTESEDYWFQVRSRVVQSTIQNLSAGKIKNLSMPVPIKSVQLAICKFLDHDLGETDILIERYNNLIVLLQERRMAMIARAVTRGIRNDLEFKQSGVPWLGEVPTHWEVLPIRRLSRGIQTGLTPSDADLADEGALPWFTPGDFNAEVDLHSAQRYVAPHATGRVRIFPAGSVLTVGIGATLGKVGLSSHDSSGNQQVNAITPNHRVLPRFLAFALAAQESTLRTLAQSSTLPILNQSRLAAISLAVPPINEQSKIVQLLDDHIAVTNKIVNDVAACIALLRERRSSLVSAIMAGDYYDEKLAPRSAAGSF